MNSCKQYGDDCTKCNGFKDNQCAPLLDALDYIAKIADGGMRDAITLLDKCLAFSSTLTVENVIKALGTLNYDEMFALLRSLTTYTSEAVISFIENIHNSGRDLKQFIKQFTNFVLDVSKYLITESCEYISIPSIYTKELDSFKVFDYPIYTLLETLVNLNSSIKWDDTPKYTIEATLLLFAKR